MITLSHSKNPSYQQLGLQNLPQIQEKEESSTDIKQQTRSLAICQEEIQLENLDGQHAGSNHTQQILVSVSKVLHRNNNLVLQVRGFQGYKPKSKYKFRCLFLHLNTNKFRNNTGSLVLTEILTPVLSFERPT